jgi:D-serine deaminase-like pyridoxal phosphate-dependent protein
MRLHDLPTPALWVDLAALDHNIDAMAAARPGRALRPHVKAFKSTALARHVRNRGGHASFCCATLKEVDGLVAAGLGHDVLLANETLDVGRLTATMALARDAGARVTIAVDSSETIAAASVASHRVGAPLDVLVDVDVGLPRCGCRPDLAGPLAEAARTAGLEVRGVMGYEGHVVGNPDRAWRAEQVAASMSILRTAHADVGGDVTSAGGTGTYDLHDWVGEVQAGSYLLMDTHYARLELPFRQALFVEATVVSTSDRHAVADAGLKAFGMDHGDPSVDGFRTFFTSDEHTTFVSDEHPTSVSDDSGRLPRVGQRVRMRPGHVDPTVAYHERLHVVDASDPDGGGDVVDVWPIDLRNW